MKTIFFFLVLGTVAWAVVTTFEYVSARILAPGFGLEVPNFAAFGWVTFFIMILYGVGYAIKAAYE